MYDILNPPSKNELKKNKVKWLQSPLSSVAPSLSVNSGKMRKLSGLKILFIWLFKIGGMNTYFPKNINLDQKHQM